MGAGNWHGLILQRSSGSLPGAVLKRAGRWAGQFASPEIREAGSPA
ncbi:MAG: hypothetical protein P4L50_09930 [Anaerolineaceae bacterium]|nr:hypothetical protein [Anaerolineaceae bacterium]